jgi:hypothetical protein
MIGKARMVLAHDLTVYSDLLATELSTFVEHDDGKLAAQDGCHDDTVLALTCSIWGMEAAGLVKNAEEEAKDRKASSDPFRLDNIISELRRSHGDKRGPFRAQHRA